MPMREGHTTPPVIPWPSLYRQWRLDMSLSLRSLPTADLLARYESLAYDRAEWANGSPESSVLDVWLEHTKAEIGRREALRSRTPLKWPTKRFKPEDYRTIKERLPLAEFLEREVGVRFDRANGKQKMIPCLYPDHVDDTASFRVNTENNTFYCFGCLRGGDIFTLWQALMGLSSFAETARDLARKAGVKA
jgi:hypothetical protein